MKLKYKFDFLHAKEKFNKRNGEFGSCDDFPIVGHLWWTKPQTVLWIFATNNEEDYEGSQTQFGITEDGTVVWGFYSHCSCNYYSDYEGEFKELEEKDYKQYELEKVPAEFLKIIKERLAEIERVIE